MAELNAKLLDMFRAMSSQFDELDRRLSDPAITADYEQVRELSIKRSAMAEVVARFRRRQQVAQQIAEHERLVAAPEDAELAELAASELPGLREERGRLDDQLVGDLLTAEDRAVGAVILEVRAGTGGAEAALWAGDLFQMYQRYAAIRGWQFTPMDWSEGEQGGFRMAVASVTGPGVWQGLGYESGVHSVKRVPATETQGRIHTSTATVAVLPEPEKLDIVIPESDVKIDVTTAQGPGGQNVNKVATAVKMVHMPTGIEVRMQESKSQQQNRARAWQLLRARVYDHHQRLKHAERAQSRASMIGSGDRSERIRTYRYKESVVVDHRVEQSFPLQAALAGELGPMVEVLAARDLAQRLESM